MTDAPRPRPRPIVLVVLDGFGIGPDPAVDAIAAARMPTWRGLWRDWPHATLRASGGRRRAAARPDGQLARSATSTSVPGVRCCRTCRGSTRPSPTARSSSARPCSKRARVRHGPTGDSTSSASSARVASTPTTGTWSRWSSWRRGRGCAAVRVHALLDGRDTPPRSAARRSSPTSRRGSPWRTRTRGSRRSAVATAAMDRDGRWDRVERGYDAIVHGVGEHAPSATAAVEAAYARGENDEFVAPDRHRWRRRHRPLRRCRSSTPTSAPTAPDS